MAKATQKTTATTGSVLDFIKSVEDNQKQNDCNSLVEIIQKQSGFEPVMWGTAIIGFGTYHYKYESGHEGNAPLVGFSPRKKELSLYIANFEGRETMLSKLGKHKAAKACIYIKKLADIDVDVLKKIITASVKYIQEKYKQ